MLSGMGRDGLAGSRRLVERGGAMLAQDRHSAAVWGMPRVVAEAGPRLGGAAAGRARPRGSRQRAEAVMEVSDASRRILAGLLEARTGQQLAMNRRWRIETALRRDHARARLRHRSTSSSPRLVAGARRARSPTR